MGETKKAMNTTLESPSAIHKPRKVVVPISTGLAWGKEFGFLYQEKADGRFAIQEIVDRHFVIAKLAGELMADGTFYAFDILEHLGEYFLQKQLWQRHIAFDLVMEHSRLPENVRRIQESREGGKLLAEVLARGGEGVVRKRLDSPWGTPFEACKRVSDFICIVKAIGTSQSVEISDAATGEPRGKIKLGGGKVEKVRVGSILKVNAFGTHPSGLLREAVLDRDSNNSWLVSF